jgi:protein-serine/threonine kinase
MKALLGKGSFGEVYLVKHKRSSYVYAMKVIRKNKVIGRNLVRYAMTERNVLSYIRHPFIVRLYFAFQTPSCLVLGLEYCSGGSLAQYLHRESRLQENIVRLYIAEICMALEHLHARQVAFRDLKPDNIVIDEIGHAMLTDFGLSKEGVEGIVGAKSFCGSIRYLAPEILARKGHGVAVDLYGLGVVAYECLVGSPPFYSPNREKLFHNISSAVLNIPHYVPAPPSSLIGALMQRDPTKRIGSKQTSDVRQHPWFDGMDFEKVLLREVPVPGYQPVTVGKDDPDGTKKAEKVSSPFEGRLEAQVLRIARPPLVSGHIHGWEFGTSPANGSFEPSRSTSPANGSFEPSRSRSPLPPIRFARCGA